MNFIFEKNGKWYKNCTKCLEIKEVSLFNKQTRGKNGIVPSCKECCKKNWKSKYSNNKSYKQERQKWYKSYYHSNIEKMRNKYLEYKNNPNNKQKRKERRRNYYLKYKDKILKKCEKMRKTEKYKKRMRDYVSNRCKNDINFKLRHNLRCRIHHALNGQKNKKTLDLSGCSIEEFKKHIELTFKPGMSWNNHGEWQIDHIIPCRAFNLIKEEEQFKCFNYKNLQALWKEENLIKNDKLPNDIRARDLTQL